jgi:hypothetical protein
MSFSNYLEHAVLDYLFGVTSFTPSGTLYAGLSTTTPTDSGTNFTEPGSGYARAQITNNKLYWSNAAQVAESGSVHNILSISFPQATGGNWGTVTHYGLFDRVTGGNMLLQAALSGGSRTIQQNDTASFASGTMIIRLS